MTSAKLKNDSNLIMALFENGMPLKELEDQLKTIEEHKDHPDYEIPQRLYNDILYSSSIVHVELPDNDVIKVEVTQYGIHEILFLQTFAKNGYYFSETIINPSINFIIGFLTAISVEMMYWFIIRTLINHFQRKYSTLNDT